MYWIMGIHSGQAEFKPIDKLGIFNPRQNVAYTINVADIPKEVVRTVEHDIIGYGKDLILRKKYKEGDIVEHRTFGKGKIEKVSDAIDDQILTIRFEKVGIKKTMANFAPLTKITEE